MPQPMTDYLFESLPAIYRRDGRDGFVYRLLSLFGDVLAELEDKVDGIHNYLSADRAPEGFLPWLASWVALVLDETWPVEKRRRLIKETVNLYRWRGTIHGLKTFVEIYTGMTPEIIEHFKAGWQVGVRSTIGVDTKVYELSEDAHCFSVVINSYDELSPEQKARIVAVIEAEKPAHTKVLHYGWAAFFWQLGVRSTVGLDMRVG